MNETFREQHPLLYENLSEEEHTSPRYQRRFRPMVTKGRARNNVKGAAAIFRLWPDHWTSSVTYWWLGLGMIGLVTIVIYNSVVVFSMLPPTKINKEPRMRAFHTASPTPVDVEATFNVYMHLIVDTSQEVDLNNYMPYIDILANKYSDFKYHLIIVFNDTALDKNVLSAEENNELALNLLWSKNDVHHSQINNVIIEYITLSKYMNNSPLRQYWKKLPEQFTKFLTRAVSIWDKGGIAFNPILLTPRSPSADYIDKVQTILKNYHKNFRKNTSERKSIRKPHIGKKKRVNNIRDIIDALENDNEMIENVPPYNLKEDNFKQPQRPTSVNDGSNSQKIHPKFSKFMRNISLADNIKSPDIEETLVMAESKVNNVSDNLQISNDTRTVGILPMFLELLFRNKPKLNSFTEVNQEESRTDVNQKKTKTIKRNVAAGHENIDFEQKFEHFDKKEAEKLKPLIIPRQHDSEKSIESDYKYSDGNNQFTIDFKGNIVASAIPCHAFLGTMFNSAVHHTHESLTDFIITELSIFCKGDLSSCKGIDVILL